MSIDQAIAKYKEITKTDAICPAHCNISCDKCVQESEQLAEWLEELKTYRECNVCEYNKAIDDFAKKLKSDCREHYIDCEPYSGIIADSILYEDDIEEIAEQLKAGD